jgi:hypothetical protein
MTLTRPVLTNERIEEIQRLLLENPDIKRTQLSKRICELWGWQSPSGQLKDISCRDMLRMLDKTGIINLPPAVMSGRKPGARITLEYYSHDNTPIECYLNMLTPLSVDAVEGSTQLKEFKSLINEYHYLGLKTTVGENMKYIVRSASGKTLACLLFGSAAWSCRDRDIYIGWDKDRRRQSLHFLSNNHRFLVLPWIHVPCLASHTLSVISKRISNDWETKYGHPLYALETFVEAPARFRGTVYQAANWIHVGRTTGRGRDGGHHNTILPEKDIYIYPLNKKYKRLLAGD